MRSSISIEGCVRPLVGPSVRLHKKHLYPVVILFKFPNACVIREVKLPNNKVFTVYIVVVVVVVVVVVDFVVVVVVVAVVDDDDDDDDDVTVSTTLPARFVTSSVDDAKTTIFTRKNKIKT